MQSPSWDTTQDVVGRETTATTNTSPRPLGRRRGQGSPLAHTQLQRLIHSSPLTTDYFGKLSARTCYTQGLCLAAHWVLGRQDSFTAFNVHLPLDLTAALRVGFTTDTVSRILVAWGLKGRVDLVKVEQLLSRGLAQSSGLLTPKPMPTLPANQTQTLPGMSPLGCAKMINPRLGRAQ